MSETHTIVNLHSENENLLDRLDGWRKGDHDTGTLIRWAAAVIRGTLAMEASAIPPEGTRLVLMTDELFAQLGATSVEWGNPDEHGRYTPTVRK